jgi:hypothetical protein
VSEDSTLVFMLVIVLMIKISQQDTLRSHLQTANETSKSQMELLSLQKLDKV